MVDVDDVLAGNYFCRYPFLFTRITSRISESVPHFCCNEPNAEKEPFGASNNKMKRIALSLIALAAIVACDKISTTPLDAGDSVPAFTVTMSDGTKMNQDTPDGKAGTLLFFFNTSDGKCQDELPVIQKVYDALGKTVAVCPVSVAEKDSNVKAYWDAKGLTMPYSAQKDKKVYNLFAAEGLPRIYICKEGKIMATFTETRLPSYEELSKELAEQLNFLIIEVE